ncbi:MAG: TetR/AcrR family transcriptional regulator [Bacilli bacterium]|nr:TetR/AcrR family transcriptional regulator [Bacilli bacterium]
MGKDTREKILENALDMFANKGYEGTNIRELSDALGVSKGAMYRHYESKEQLWDSVISKVEVEYEKNIGSYKEMPEIPNSTDELKELTLRMMSNSMHDPNLIKYRKMLVREQYKDEKTAILSDQYFLTNILDIYKEIFKGMMGKKLLKQDDYEILALEYSATIAALIHQKDRFPHKEEEIINRGTSYIDHFIKMYKLNKE